MSSPNSTPPKYKGATTNIVIGSGGKNFVEERFSLLSYVTLGRENFLIKSMDY